ncbi:TM0106 family RecB-like putative nuclease [Leptolyngbya sp. AN02str]|uniref:TM0106 family RecB-like putative nuclease n=1 Tax=Leptolyngbya sp. AN02str TaxID=3423363 RepID=UPI003D3160A4
MPAHLRPLVPTAQPDDIWITDKVLFDYQRCHRRAFLDAYGDVGDRDAPSDYLRKLRQDSQAHQFAVLGTSPAEQPIYPAGDWLAGAEATLELMRRGVERIARPVLVAEQTRGVKLVSTPDLLIRHPGVSRFGSWVYLPTDIRLGKRPKLDYQIAIAFHTYLLSLVQSTPVERGWLMLRQRGAYGVNVTDLMPQMHDALAGCIEMMRSRQEPEVFIAHNRCELCHWYSHCYNLATQTEHLSLLPGVTPSRYVHLKQLNITTLEALAAAIPKKLEPLPGFGAQVAHKMVHQAKATLSNQALPNPLLMSSNPSQPLLQPHELPTAPIELYFDIEAAPEHNLVYLHGVLVVDRLAQTETFHALLAHTPNDEHTAWQHFLDLVWQYPTAPIYHFCPFEVQTVQRLAQAYNTHPSYVEPLMSRFVDLHERITRIAILPVESYALKSIAKWLGFHWQNPEANGAQSICWYADWQQTGDRTHLDAILQYNEDDCRATHRVKDWLVTFVGHTKETFDFFEKPFDKSL